MRYKVLRIINRFNIGGPTYNVSYLSKYLSDDFETLLVGGKHDEGEEDSLHIPHQLGLEPRVIDMERDIRFKKDYKAYQEIRKIIREYRPDIVHTHASKAGALGRLAASKEKVPVIVHTFHGHVFHSYFGSLKTSFFKTIERYLAKKSTDIVAISQQQKQELTTEHNITEPSKVSVIPLGFDLNKFKEKVAEKKKHFRSCYGIDDREIAVGIIGRLAPIKDHSFFIEVAHQILKESRNAHVKFMIIGDGNEKHRIQEQIRQLPDDQQKQFVFTSWIKDIDRVIAGLDIVVLTSKNEGTPVSLIEAQAGGKPVVSTNVGGVQDVIDQNETGFYVTQGDVMKYTEKVQLLIDSESTRKKMGENGKKKAFQHYSYHRLCQDMEELYKRRLKNLNLLQ